MRLNYLQSGGSDQFILKKFTELENEARLKNQNSLNQYPVTISNPQFNNQLIPQNGKLSNESIYMKI